MLSGAVKRTALNRTHLERGVGDHREPRRDGDCATGTSMDGQMTA
jgi:hypothetical protein